MRTQARTRQLVLPRSFPAGLRALLLILSLVLSAGLSGCASSGFRDLRGEDRCDACNRIAAPPEGGRWKDERAACGECREEAVVSLGEAEDVLEEAREGLEDVLGAELEASVGLRLVDRPALLKAAGSLAHPRLRAFCQIRERFLGKELVSRSFTIQVVTALPRGLLRGILAHELFHVWQAEAGAPEDAQPAWREGSANWAQWSLHREWGETLWAEQIEGDPDPTYGAGFRRFRKLADLVGVEGALERIRRRKNF